MRSSPESPNLSFASANLHPGHGTLYRAGHVPYRDTSLSNVMIALNPLPSPSRSLSQLYGFLIDLGYSVTVDEEFVPLRSGVVPHRTEALPFMTIDILMNGKTIHLYHHDVESFLYVSI